MYHFISVSQYLRVDAICINQLDVREQAEQIRSSRSIYHDAQRVVIWLGLSDAGADELCELNAYLCAIRTNSNYSRLLQSRDVVGKFKPNKPYSFPRHAGFETKMVHRLATSNYRIRTWTVLKRSFPDMLSFHSLVDGVTCLISSSTSE